MLKFFRRYQKIFFAITAFIIVVTFSFFGTQSIVTKIAKPKDKDIGIAYDGSIIKLSDIENMSNFLATDSYDSPLAYSYIRSNLLNDGVIRIDIFKSNLAKIFFEKYLDQIKPSFESKFEKIKKYKPFVHFNDPSISLASTLQMISPDTMMSLGKLRSKKELNLDFFNSYVDFYNEQGKVQPELLRNILMYQEKQNKIEPDPRLYQDSFAFFGFDSTIDWAGKDFIDLISQFIINTAKVAEEKGYEVTMQEALSDLMSNLKRSLENNKLKDSINEYFKRMLNYLRMDEKTAAKIWRQILLFRRYLQDVSNNTLIDSLAHKEFADYSSTKANVKLYKLPPFLCLNNFEDLMRFEMYLMATADKSGPLDVPDKFKSLEKIERNYPELIEKKYLVKVKHTTLEKASVKVRVKDMYFWQLQDANWEKLRKNFEFIPVAKTKKDKLGAIDQLDVSDKDKLDAFSRIEIVKQNPLLIEEALLDKEEKEYDFYFSKNSNLPVKLKDTKELIDLLNDQDKIEKYTQDNNNYYAIQVLQRPTQKSLLPFEKALKDKKMDEILNEYLLSRYLDLRETYPQKFKDENDEFKPFDSVRKELAEIVFEDVLSKLKLLNITKEKSLDNLSRYRLYVYMENVLQKIVSNENYTENMNPQFQVLCESMEISRSKNARWLEKAAFSMEENKYSSINLDSSGFEFIFLESFKKADIQPNKIEKAKKAISKETSSLLVRKLIKMFMEKKYIVLPVEGNKNV